jgi:hypothetical protein
MDFIIFPLAIQCRLIYSRKLKTAMDRKMPGIKFIKFLSKNKW